MGKLIEALHWVWDLSKLTTEIQQQCLSCRFDVLVNFGQVFSQFLGDFIVYFEYSLFIVNVINAILCHIFVEHQIGVMSMGLVAKH